MKDLPSDSDDQGSEIDSSVVSGHSRVADVVTQCHQSHLESCGGGATVTKNSYKRR